MSSKFRSKSRVSVILDTNGLKQLRYGNKNKTVVYTLLSFLIVLALYFLTKDWKGLTSPEEVDLGSVRLVPHTNRKHAISRRHCTFN